MALGLRRMFPPSGQRYELFDCGVFLLLLAAIGYVLTTPPAVTDRALYAPFESAPIWVWGSLLSACGAFAILASYVPRLLRAGYVVMVLACTFWSLSFLIGIVFFDGQPRALMSVLIYAWIARRIAREGWAPR